MSSISWALGRRVPPCCGASPSEDFGHLAIRRGRTGLLPGLRCAHQCVLVVLAHPLKDVLAGAVLGLRDEARDQVWVALRLREERLGASAI